MSNCCRTCNQCRKVLTCNESGKCDICYAEDAKRPRTIKLENGWLSKLIANINNDPQDLGA